MIDINLLPHNRRIEGGGWSFRNVVSCLLALAVLVALFYGMRQGYLAAERSFRETPAAVDPAFTERQSEIEKQKFAVGSASSLVEEMKQSGPISPADSDGARPSASPDGDASGLGVITMETVSSADRPAPAAPEVKPENTVTTDAAAAAMRPAPPVPMRPAAPAPTPDTPAERDTRRAFGDVQARALNTALARMRDAAGRGEYRTAIELGDKALGRTSIRPDLPDEVRELRGEVARLREDALSSLADLELEKQLEREKLRKEAEKPVVPTFDQLPIRVEGIIWTADNPRLFVNGNVVGVGERVPGIDEKDAPVVTGIDPAEVRFAYLGQTFAVKVAFSGGR